MDIEARVKSLESWRAEADAMIERNRCNDPDVQTNLIEIAENRIFRREAIRRLDGIRKILGHISATLLAIGGIYGAYAAVTAYWGGGS